MPVQAEHTEAIVALKRALETVYSGAGWDEASALYDHLQDLGYGLSAPRYEVIAYDHGFAQPGVRRFEHQVDAERFRDEQSGGRTVSGTGRCVSDISWRVIDREA